MPDVNTTERDLLTLRSTVLGEVVLPQDEGWDTARQAWNLVADQRPVAVVFPAGREDVQAVVGFARRNDLRVAAQGTGHGAAARESLDDAILLNMSQLNDVQIDPDAQTARVEAGAIWQAVAEAAAEHGLAGLAGSSPDVGVVGYSLGGGIGWLARKYGMATNSILAIELVTADGESVRADAENEPELFWALRGGGGNFGIVTAMEFRLFPVAEIYAGMMLWPIEHARDVLNGYATWVDSVPDEMTSLVRLLQVPPIPDVPEFLRGKSFVGIEAAYLGTPEDGDALLAPLREIAPTFMDTVQTMPAAELHKLHMDPEQPVPGLGHHTLLADLTSETIEALLEAAGPGSGSPLVSVEVRHLGGALGRTPQDHGALPVMDASFIVYGVGIPMSPEIATATAASLDALVSGLEQWSTGGTYSNFAERPLESQTAFGSETNRRLSEIRASVDPKDLFLANHPISA